MTFDQFNTIVINYNQTEHNLRRIPKGKFVEIIKHVLYTDKEYAEKVWHDFQAYPIPWLNNRRPIEQTIELLKLL